MIVADRPGLEVLMLERNANMVFAGGMWVFPGGAVDPGEADEFEAFCDGLNDRAASAILGVEAGGLAYWVAAIRENFEETGLLLGRRYDGSPLHGVDLSADRAALNERQCTFLDVVKRHQLRLDTSAVHYVAHWITPLGSPRRFSARFFITSAPKAQDVIHDDNETVGWAWVTPAQALARCERKQWVMMTPTVGMLRCLVGFNCAAAVLAAARAGLPDEQVRVRYSNAEKTDYTIVLPGEPGYENGDTERENGWIRLRPPG